MSLTVRLRHRFPGFDLDVDFEAPPGITVLFGRSGSGKTSVIEAVAGLLRPDKARIVAGERVLCDTGAGVNLPPHRRRLGYVFQEGRLFPHLTVRRNLAYGRWFAPRGARLEETGRVVEMLGLGPLLERRPAALSGGEKARVALGRALLAGPELILADEPLSALDAPRKAEILPYLERLRDETRLPILYVSHDASEVARLATSVVALEAGRVTGQGPVEAVLGDPELRPLGARAAGAVISARVVRHAEDGLSELEAGGAPLVLPRVSQAPGEWLRLRIAAHDVIVALERPEGLSALNALPGRLVSVHPGEGPGAMVVIDTPAGRVLARITARSVRRLALAPGVACHAVLKTVSLAPQDAGV